MTAPRRAGVNHRTRKQGQRVWAAPGRTLRSPSPPCFSCEVVTPPWRVARALGVCTSTCEWLAQRRRVGAQHGLRCGCGCGLRFQGAAAQGQSGRQLPGTRPEHRCLPAQLWKGEAPSPHPWRGQGRPPHCCGGASAQCAYAGRGDRTPPASQQQEAATKWDWECSSQ